MFAIFATVLCLACVSHSAPLACDNLFQPLKQLDPLQFEGRWVLIAGSLNDSADADTLKGRDSITFDLNNSTHTQVIRVGDNCEYYPINVSVEGYTLTSQTKSFAIAGTFFHTSCTDCAVLRLDLKALHYNSTDFYLFSRRREVGQKDMEDFRAQVECLSMPPPIVMDQTKELCPEKSTKEEKET